ncbi:MAG: helix-turn-helix domain-containing protein [Coriobacteriia bacterium]|nr:helix-turn-helix domain-containing protein [Coriobacteriia bacterium]
MEDLLDIASVAEYLGVSERTVYDKVRSGELPAFKVGRLWRVRRRDLEAWLGESQQSRPERAASGSADVRDASLAAEGGLGWPTPVAMGGHAVEFWTTGGYTTADIDLVGASEPVAEVLDAWAFSERDATGSMSTSASLSRHPEPVSARTSARTSHRCS